MTPLIVMFLVSGVFWSIRYAKLSSPFCLHLLVASIVVSKLWDAMRPTTLSMPFCLHSLVESTDVSPVMVRVPEDTIGDPDTDTPEPPTAATLVTVPTLQVLFADND